MQPGVLFGCVRPLCAQSNPGQKAVSLKVLVGSGFSFEGAVEDGGEQGIQWWVQALPAGGLDLQALHCVHLRPQRTQIGHDSPLLGKGGQDEG